MKITVIDANGKSIQNGNVQIGYLYTTALGNRFKVTDIKVSTNYSALQTHATIYVTYDWQKTDNIKDFGYDECVTIDNFLLNINES